MATQTQTMLPLVEFEVAVHRSGLGVLRLGYLPAVPGPNLSEDEARKSIRYIDLAVTKHACDELVALLTALKQQFANSKSGQN